MIPQRKKIMGNWTFEVTVRENGTDSTIYHYFNRKPGAEKLATICARHGHVLRTNLYKSVTKAG